MSNMIDMQLALEGHIGKVIGSVEMLQNWDGQDIGFRFMFTDGTSVELSSRGSDEGSWVTVDAS